MTTTERTEADIFCDNLIEKCAENARPAVFAAMADHVLRPYLHVLDGSEQASSSDFANALSGLVATMMATFIGRVVPKDDGNAASDIAQTFVDALAASLSADINNSFTVKRTQADIMRDALAAKKKGEVH